MTARQAAENPRGEDPRKRSTKAPDRSSTVPVSLATVVEIILSVENENPSREAKMTKYVLTQPCTLTLNKE